MASDAFSISLYPREKRVLISITPPSRFPENENNNPTQHPFPRLNRKNLKDTPHTAPQTLSTLTSSPNMSLNMKTKNFPQYTKLFTLSLFKYHTRNSNILLINCFPICEYHDDDVILMKYEYEKIEIRIVCPAKTYYQLSTNSQSTGKSIN